MVVFDPILHMVGGARAFRVADILGVPRKAQWLVFYLQEWQGRQLSLLDILADAAAPNSFSVHRAILDVAKQDLVEAQVVISLLLSPRATYVVAVIFNQSMEFQTNHAASCQRGEPRQG